MLFFLSTMKPSKQTIFHRLIITKLLCVLKCTDATLCLNSRVKPYCNFMEDQNSGNCKFLCYNIYNFETLNVNTEMLLNCTEQLEFDICNTEVPIFPLQMISKTVMNFKKIVWKIGSTHMPFVVSPESVVSPFDQLAFSNSALIHIEEVYSLNKWDWKAFSALKPSHAGAYVDIVIKTSELNYLPSEFSEIAQGAVNSVSITNCNLIWLAEGSLAEFFKITAISLQNNRIKLLRRNVFSRPANNLRSLNLRDNPLSSVPHELFVEMPILMHVDLSRTNLHRLDQDVFKHIMDKMRLRVEALKITCDESILWLQEKKENVNAKNCTCAEPAEYKNWSLQRFFHQINQTESLRT